MINQYCTNTNNTNKNNNVLIEPTIFQQHQKNYKTGIQQRCKINTNKTKNNKSSLQNNGQNQKNTPPDSVLTDTELPCSRERLYVPYNKRSITDNTVNTITPSKSNLLDKSSETKNKQTKYFFSPNTIVTRRDHVENPTYETHTVITTRLPKATDDST